MKKIFTFIIVIASAISFAQSKKSVTVNNVKDFVKSIASNTTITLESGTYNLSNAANVTNPDIVWTENFDGVSPVISYISNLTIKGDGNVEILIKPRYAFVFTFENCNNIKLKNLTIGHTKGGYCDGGVLSFFQCDSININECELFGSGTIGLNLDFVNHFNFSKSVIRECTYGIMKITHSNNIRFKNSEFKNNKEFHLFEILESSSDIEFYKCEIKNNFGRYFPAYLFNIEQTCKNIKLEKSEIIDNDVEEFINNKSKLIQKDNKFSGNKFDK